MNLQFTFTNTSFYSGLDSIVKCDGVEAAFEYNSMYNPDLSFEDFNFDPASEGWMAFQPSEISEVSNFYHLLVTSSISQYWANIERFSPNCASIYKNTWCLIYVYHMLQHSSFCAIIHSYIILVLRQRIDYIPANGNRL